jgi:hypothetical protein
LDSWECSFSIGFVQELLIKKDMIKKTMGAIAIAVAWVNISLTQPSGSIESTNWGASVFGVKMSIALNTNAISPGSESMLLCQITNCSTNTVYALNSDRVITATVFLTNKIGESYNLTPPPKFNILPPVTGHFYDPISANSVLEWSIPLKIDKSIHPGEYEMYAERHFLLTLEPNGAHKLTSNIVPLEVTK